jgi:peptide/nickel transport system substrate-binding protein
MQTMLHEDMPELNIVWPRAIFPVNTRLWNIQSTDFIGARPTGTMTVISAEPTAQNDEGRLVVGGQQELNVPNPLSPSSNDLQYLLKLAYDTPRRIGLDGEVQNWAVETIETIDDTTLDMTLREGMTWHDGESVTAEDLKFTFDFLTEYTFPKYDPYTNAVASTSMQTDRTVRVNLEQANTSFTFAAMTFMKILPQHIWSDVPDQVDEPVNYDMPVEEMVGSGPFEITSLTTDELQMETFGDHFYDVAFDEFLFVNRASNEAVRAAFEQQNIHLTTASPPTTVTNQLVQNDYLRKSVAPSVFPMKLSLNMRKQPCSSRAFRRALFHATDAEAISQLIYSGEVNPADGTLVHPELKWGRDDLPDVGTADVERARQVLRDAGFTYDSNDNLRYPSDM